MICSLNFDPIPKSLAEDDLREIYHELWTIKANYYQLGIELGLPPGELQTIKQENSQNIAQAFTEVLLRWLKGHYNVGRYGRPTWQRLKEAVGSPSGGSNAALAEKIAKKIAENRLLSSMNH